MALALSVREGVEDIGRALWFSGGRGAALQAVSRSDKMGAYFPVKAGPAQRLAGEIAGK
ncbi:hypothetical protein GCM10027180_37650 [Microbulbifer echini]